MKLAVVGASGYTGLCLIQQSLDSAHEVVAIMRNTTNFSIQHENLKVIEGNVLSAESLTDHFRGCDAVMSCMGSRTYRNVTVYSESAKSIIEAMKEADVSRFIAITSWCTSDNPRDRGPFVLEWILKPTVLKHALIDMALMEEYLKESCSDIRYTVVRPPELSNGPITDEKINVQVERLHVPGGTNKMSREDVARFMLACLKTEDYEGKMVAIGV